MKKKVLIIISVFTLLAIAGGLALLYSIKHTSANLHDLILLHQVEIQREQLLLKVYKVQEELSSHGTEHPASTEVLLEHVNGMEASIEACFHCHHTPSVTEQLLDIQQQIGQFDAQVTRTLAGGRQGRRFRDEREKANIIGDSIISKLNTMIIITNQMLLERIGHGRQDKRNAEIIVFVLVVCGPLMVAVFGFTTLYGFANPIQVLLAATKRLQSGELDVKVAGLKDEFGELAIAFNDMADALRARMKEITEREHRYRLLFETAGEAIFILEAEGKDTGRILSANRAAAAMHGYTVEELLTMNIRDLDAPRAVKEFSGRMSKVLQGDWITARIEHVKKDGTVFPVEISAGMFEFNDRKYVMAIDRDMTERHRAVEVLQRTEHLRATAELAAGLAHEIKNPLAGIKITMATLTEESSILPEDRVILSRVIDEIGRIERLIKGLLNFARPPQLQCMPVDVHAVLDGAVQLVMQGRAQKDGRPPSVSVVRKFAQDCPEIIADPLQLRQVFVNMLINAVDSMDDDGTLTLSTECNAGASAITVSIADTGGGIDARVRDRIFQPFFTTKAGGTGLGLAISRRLVEEHGGRISIDHGTGAGTVFTVTLPCDRGKDAERYD